MKPAIVHSNGMNLVHLHDFFPCRSLCGIHSTVTLKKIAMRLATMHEIEGDRMHAWTDEFSVLVRSNKLLVSR